MRPNIDCYVRQSGLLWINIVFYYTQLPFHTEILLRLINAVGQYKFRLLSDSSQVLLVQKLSNIRHSPGYHYITSINFWFWIQSKAYSKHYLKCMQADYNAPHVILAQASYASRPVLQPSWFRRPPTPHPLRKICDDWCGLTLGWRRMAMGGICPSLIRELNFTTRSATPGFKPVAAPMLRSSARVWANSSFPW